MNDAIRLALLVTAAMTVTACGDADDATPAEETAKASSAITTLGYWWWGTPGNNGAPLDLGSDADRTCFLQGVTGSVTGATFGDAARVEVLQREGRWWLETRAGNGPGAMGHATCIPVTKNRQIMKWPGNVVEDGVAKERAVTYVSNSATTECFLTGVAAKDGFKSPESRVELTRVLWAGKPIWILGGHLYTPGLPFAIPGGSATAYCVDMVQAVSTFAFQNVGGSFFSTITAQENTACGLTKLEGKFAEGDWYEGARIFPEDNLWKVIAHQSKRIEGRCYKNFVFNPL